ncbi:hypothetical protein [Aegicerativicinus sediminis]|uniref:hypothetical protein n=1 Tax=Aegicerativicinus sediminis TaxID=2893202 RepID=UPI001E30B501|nr:hypothetical protein [Aegicerativicinus sediminis]
MKKAKIIILISLAIIVAVSVYIIKLYNDIEKTNIELLKTREDLELTTRQLDELNKNYEAISNPDISENLPTVEIDSTQQELIKNLFSEKEATRRASTVILLTEWTKDSTLIPNLVEFSEGRLTNEDYNVSGIINTIFVLNRMDEPLLRHDSLSVSGFINKVSQLKERKETQEQLNKLKQRLQ